MPKAKKTAIAPKGKVAKPIVAKAKTASTAKKVPVAKAKAPSKASKSLPKAQPNIVPIEIKAKKVRGPNKAKATGSFAELLKIQNQYEDAKKNAKAELKKEYDGLIRESEKIKAQYKELFNVAIESAPKARGSGPKRTSGKIPGLRPFTLKEVEDFVDQKKKGVTIKIKGRRPKSIARMEDVYKNSEDPKEILKILNK